MKLAVLLVGLALLATGLASFVLPGALRKTLAWFTTGNRLGLAVLGRLAVGLVLLLGASLTRWPFAAITLGLLFLAGGAAIPLLGEARVEQIAGWWLARPDAALRAWSSVIIVTGGFIAWLAAPDFG